MRSHIKAEWENSREIVDWGIGIFQDNSQAFIVEEETTEETEAPPEEVEAAIALTADEEDEILEMLSSEGGIELLRSNLDNLIAGEEDNKLLAFTLLLSGKATDLKMKQMILFSGESGSGKSTLMSLADLFHTKDVGRFTKHALDWSNLAGYEILRLKEFGMMDSEDQGVSTLKFLSADDQGYIVEMPIKDPETGEMVTMQKRIDPITVISSTIRTEVDSQYTRRNWPISPDESEEQTERVRLWMIHDGEETDEVNLGLRRETSYARSKRLLKVLVQRIEVCDCIVPFPNALTGILKAVDIPNRAVRLRVRGDYKKLMILIKLYGILQQNLLPSVNTPAGKVVFMLPENALQILQVAIAPLTTMLTGSNRKTEALLDAMERFIQYSSGVYLINKELRDTIGSSMGYASDTINRKMKELERLGHLGSEMAGREKIYKLGTSIHSIRAKLSIVRGKLDNPDLLTSQMYAEGLERLYRLCGSESEGGTHAYMSQLERVRYIFAGDEMHTPPSPPVSDPHIDLSEENPVNENHRGLITVNDESPVNRDVCYHCRENLADPDRFRTVIYGHEVYTCRECYEHEKGRTLQEN